MPLWLCGVLGFVDCLLFLRHWTWFIARLYGVGLGRALCKVTGFDSAVAALLSKRYDKR